MDTQTEKAFLCMIAEQERMIYKVCYAFTDSHDDLEDLFQEIVLNLWEGFQGYRGESKMSTWVYRIAMNTCISYSQHSKRRPKTYPLTARMEAKLAADVDVSHQFKELFACINQLNKKERALILLWFEDLSYQEIADILGISKDNVGVKLNHIRDKLKKM